tara:strand:- start:4959 stop:6428 length:1470 start_codon:yes stop_codon:yes gene_type:complete
MTNNKELFQAEIDNALLNFKNAKYHETINILDNLKKKLSHFIVYWYLGHSYFRIYDYSSAINCIKKSIELKDRDTLNLSFLAEIFLASNNYKEAIKLFKEVLKLDKTNINSLFNLAKVYSDLGELQTAEKYYNEVIKNEPTNTEAEYELIKINSKYLTNDLLKKAENKEISEDSNNLNSTFSKFIIAENFKREKNYRLEFDNLLEAHTLYLKKKRKASKQEFNYFTNLLPKFISKVKNVKVELSCNLKPIFIMGLPRSGTTLVENVISACDNNINVGGEAGTLSKVFFSNNIILDYDSTELGSNFNFKKNEFELLKASILKQYNQQKIKTNNEYFTDKSLENILYIDLISKIFPNAKFVYCKRNKYANLMGMLRVFLPNLYWTHSIEKIIQMMNIYNKKIKDIINENKINIKIIELENFSSDPKRISQDLFKFLELNWHDNILDESINKKRIIQTVSNLQVRKKIAEHDLSYLENYLPFLQKYGIDKLS